MENLNIAIVHEYLLKIGGAEKVLLDLHKIFPEAPIYTFLYDEKLTQGKFEDCKIITSNLQNNRFLKKRPRLLLSKYSRAIEEFDLSAFDIVISNSNSFAHGVITRPNTFHVCYCHSPMRYAWDWYHEYLAENKIDTGIKSYYIRNLLHKIRIWDRTAAERVDFWIANSKNVQGRIKKYYRKESKIIYPGVDLGNIKLSENIPDDYYVIVSRLEPYKKIEVAIKAFNENGKQLVIIGKGSYQEELKKMAHENIEFLGWQSDDSVYEYIRNGKALIFCGEEDFGLTPVEAMACGRPVIAFKKGGVTETVIDNKTGLFFDGPSAENLNRAIEELEKKYTTFVPSSCRKQAEEFSRERFLTEFKKTIFEEYDYYLERLEHEK